MNKNELYVLFEDKYSHIHHNLWYNFAFYVIN